MEEKESGTIVKKVYQEVKIEAKNSPKGSYAAGCPITVILMVKIVTFVIMEVD